MMSYDGGKGAMYHKIINRMPLHARYIEPFLGGGAVMRKKRPAEENIGLELDLGVLRSTAWNALREQGAPEREIMALTFEPAARVISGVAGQNGRAGNIVISDGGCPGEAQLATSEITMMATASWGGMAWEFRHENALAFLARLECRGDEFVYLDPPYLMDTRRNGKRIYRHEMGSEEAHRSLLEIILALDCMVAISGYWSELYADMLSGWRMDSWSARTRGGVATERLWMNYPEPTRLHDYRYLGDTYRQRDRIKRKKARWVARLKRMEPLERYALLAALDEAFQEEHFIYHHLPEYQDATV